MKIKEIKMTAEILLENMCEVISYLEESDIIFFLRELSIEILIDDNIITIPIG